MRANFYFFYLILACLLCSSLDVPAQGKNAANRIMSNPLNLSYRFYTEDGPVHRVAADPVIEYFKGKYYLFGSHSDGYFTSPDMKTWTYIHSVNLPAVKVWAPAVLVYKDAVYYMGMNQTDIYRSTHPDRDEWEKIDSKMTLSIGDPSFFKDDDERVYLIWGCSNNAPICGVEVDPEDGFRVKGNIVDLLPPNGKEHGWEVPGDNNERTNESGWNEGPCLTKANGLYYLQYATPGTEFASYSTGVYVSKNPLGPYTCSVSNPFAIKPTGFITGAGHGHSFKDKYGNHWYVGTMIVSVREKFERRVGIFPVNFDSDGYMRAQTVFSDYPFVLPNKKVDFKTAHLSADMNLLSYKKKATASSFKTGYEPAKATDENVKTWWASATGNAGEWFQIDLGRSMQVSSLQMNFADDAFTARRQDTPPIYQYTVETSLDGNNWTTLIEQSNNANDYIHELIVLDKPVNTRFVRVVNQSALNGCFSLYDLRLFGKAKGAAPSKVSDFQCTRKEDARRIAFSWKQQEDPFTRYVIRWGTDPKRIDNAVIVDGSNAEFGFFNAGLGYYFTIEAFNESGKSKQSEVIRQ